MLLDSRKGTSDQGRTTEAALGLAGWEVSASRTSSRTVPPLLRGRRRRRARPDRVPTAALVTEATAGAPPRGLGASRHDRAMTPRPSPPADQERVGSWFPVPDESDLPDDLRGLFAKARERIGFVPNVFRAYAFRPERLRTLVRPLQGRARADGAPRRRRPRADRRRRVEREPLPVLPRRARRRPARAARRPGAGRADRVRLAPGGARRAGARRSRAYAEKLTLRAASGRPRRPPAPARRRPLARGGVGRRRGGLDVQLHQSHGDGHEHAPRTRSTRVSRGHEPGDPTHRRRHAAPARAAPRADRRRARADRLEGRPQRPRRAGEARAHPPAGRLPHRRTLSPSGGEVSLAGWEKPDARAGDRHAARRATCRAARRDAVAAAVDALAPAIELVDLDRPDATTWRRCSRANIFHRAVVLGAWDEGRAGARPRGHRARRRGPRAGRRPDRRAGRPRRGGARASPTRWPTPARPCARASSSSAARSSPPSRCTPGERVACRFSGLGDVEVAAHG